jgi:hypothetical protein
MGIDDESSHPELCSEVADGVERCADRQGSDGKNLALKQSASEEAT